MKKLFIIGIAALLLVAFTVPAMAKVKIGGIIFTDFFYLDRDKENSQAWGTGNDPYQVTTIQVPNITRLYARWTNEDNVGMYIEFGIGQSASGIEERNSNGVVLRHAYGWWDVNPNFQIMAGKSTSPFSPLNPSQMIGTRSGSVNIIGVGYGNFYSGRFAQIRGTWKFGKMGRVALALVDQNGGSRIVQTYAKYFPYELIDVGGRLAQLGVDYQTNSKLPRIDIGVPLYFGPVSIYPSFLYQYRNVDVINPALSRFDNSISTYIGSLGFKAGFGPFGISAEGQWGKNWGNTRALIGTSAPCLISAAMPNQSGAINDSTSYGFWIDASYKLGVVTPHVMYGMMDSEVTAIDDVKLRGKSSFWGFSIPIDLAKGFRIRPEFMWYDDGEVQAQGNDIEDLGSYAIYGVQFQITF